MGAVAISIFTQMAEDKTPGKALALASKLISNFTKTLLKNDNLSHAAVFIYYFIKEICHLYQIAGLLN